MILPGIIIKGTKGGFTYIYATKELSNIEKEVVIYDFRQASIPQNIVGQECYGISFSPNGKAYSIYRIILDAPRSLAVGFLGISLFVPFEMKMDGNSVSELLESLMSEYKKKYIKDDKLGVETEDWGFVDNILKEYNEKFKQVNKVYGNWSSGNKDAAYIYYGKNPLPEYFEEIFQSKYTEFRQVLLIDEKLKDTDNILQAIKHSEDITNLIDTENPQYLVKVKVGADTKVHVYLNSNNDKCYHNDFNVLKNDIIKIEFTKLFHDPLTYIGSIFELSEKKSDTISIDRDTKTVTIINPFFQAKTKTVTFNIVDENRIPFNIEKISVRIKNSNSGKEKDVNSNGEAKFEGFEIGEKWNIEVNAGEMFNGYVIGFWPKEISEPKEIKLIKRKIPTNLPIFVPVGIEVASSKSGMKKIEQKKKTWWQKNDRYFMIGLVLIVFIGIFYLIYRELIPESPILKPKNDSITLKQRKDIYSYLNGMELIYDSLIQIKKKLGKLDKNDSLNLKWNDMVKLREAIDDDNRQLIDSVYKKIIGLSEEQNDFLKYILDNDFKYFRSVEKRDKLALFAIKNQMDTIISQEHGQKKEKSDNTVETKDKNNSQNILYQKENSLNNQNNQEDFIVKIRSIKKKSDLDNFDEKKMSKEQKDLIIRIRNNLSGFLSKYRVQLTDKQLLEMIKEL